jgi:hypothetical protein
MGGQDSSRRSVWLVSNGPASIFNFQVAVWAGSELEIFGAALFVVDDDDGNKGYQAGMSEFKVLGTVETPHEPDVLLFSPIDSSVLVVGTYHLCTDGQRIGSLLLYSVNVETASWYVIDVS